MCSLNFSLFLSQHLKELWDRGMSEDELEEGEAAVQCIALSRPKRHAPAPKVCVFVVRLRACVCVCV